MRRLVLAMALGGMAACAKAPQFAPPDLEVDVPSGFGQAEGVDTTAIDSTDTAWWEEFEVPQLDSLVTEALESNYDLKIAVARVDQVEALARIAGADGLPQVSVGANAARSKQNFVNFPFSAGAGPTTGEVVSLEANTFRTSLNVGWEIDLWGRVRTAKNAALADLEATQADLAAMRLSIASRVAIAWFALTEARLQVELAEQTVETFQLSADQVRKRYAQGVRTSLDLRLALANLYGAQALLESRREQFDRTQRRLEILLGRYPAGAVAAATALPSIGVGVPPGLPSELLIRRPDLFAAERRFAAAEQRVSSARRAFFPRIQLTGSAGSLTGDLENLVKGDFSVWSVAAGLTQPIFQGGRLQANLQQSKAVSDQTLAAYAATLLVAFGEVESALFAEEVLGRREKFTAAAAESSRAARILAERQYNQGIIDYINVLETQRRELNAQSELLVVRRQRLEARVNLHLALGGGFDLGSQWQGFLAPQVETVMEAPVE